MAINTIELKKGEKHRNIAISFATNRVASVIGTTRSGKSALLKSFLNKDNSQIDLNISAAYEKELREFKIFNLKGEKWDSMDFDDVFIKNNARQTYDNICKTVLDTLTDFSHHYAKGPVGVTAHNRYLKAIDAEKNNDINLWIRRVVEAHPLLRTEFGMDELMYNTLSDAYDWANRVLSAIEILAVDMNINGNVNITNGELTWNTKGNVKVGTSKYSTFVDKSGNIKKHDNTVVELLVRMASSFVDNSEYIGTTNAEFIEFISQHAKTGDYEWFKQALMLHPPLTIVLKRDKHLLAEIESAASINSCKDDINDSFIKTFRKIIKEIEITDEVQPTPVNNVLDIDKLIEYARDNYLGEQIAFKQMQFNFYDDKGKVRKGGKGNEETPTDEAIRLVQRRYKGFIEFMSKNVSKPIHLWIKELFENPKYKGCFNFYQSVVKYTLPNSEQNTANFNEFRLEYNNVKASHPETSYLQINSILLKNEAKENGIASTSDYDYFDVVSRQFDEVIFRHTGNAEATEISMDLPEDYRYNITKEGYENALKCLKPHGVPFTKSLFLNELAARLDIKPNALSIDDNSKMKSLRFREAISPAQLLILNNIFFPVVLTPHTLILLDNFGDNCDAKSQKIIRAVIERHARMSDCRFLIATNNMFTLGSIKHTEKDNIYLSTRVGDKYLLERVKELEDAPDNAEAEVYEDLEATGYISIASLHTVEVKENPNSGNDLMDEGDF